MAETLDETIDRARAAIGDPDHPSPTLTPPPTTLLGEAMVMALHEEAAHHEPDPEITSFLVLERLHAVLACPGCLQGAAQCPEHGELGDFPAWLTEVVERMWAREAARDLEWAAEEAAARQAESMATSPAFRQGQRDAVRGLLGNLAQGAGRALIDHALQGGAPPPGSKDDGE